MTTMHDNANDTDREALVHQLFTDSIEAKQATQATMASRLVAAADHLFAAIAAGGKILSCGNGGSAGDAQHFSSELVNRFERNRRALPAIALTTESSTVTAIANDASYDEVFARQLEALGQPGDVLLAFSTSGNSANVVAAVDTAHANGLSVIAVSGRDGGRLAATLADDDIELRAMANSTARIQEVHLLFIHCLCRLLEDRVCGDDPA